MAFFSVVIPLYNKAKYIQATLDSVFNQSFKDFEVIVVNDGSTDDSLKYVEALNYDNLIIINQKNKGVAAAKNVGISKAKAPYIALIDADDIWYTNHLKNLFELINKFPKAVLYCTNYEVLYSKDLVRAASFNLKNDAKYILVDNYFEASITNSVAWTSAVAFEKEDFKTLGQFNETLETYEDIDLWIRYALKGSIAFHTEITMRYKIYLPDSLTKSKNNVLRSNFLNSFKTIEDNHRSLKRYLDINRFSVALLCKISRETELYKGLKKEIDLKNLNIKQTFLLYCPRGVLLLFKTFQNWLIKNNIYISAFK